MNKTLREQTFFTLVLCLLLPVVVLAQDSDCPKGSVLTPNPLKPGLPHADASSMSTGNLALEFSFAPGVSAVAHSADAYSVTRELQKDQYWRQIGPGWISNTMRMTEGAAELKPEFHETTNPETGETTVSRDPLNVRKLELEYANGQQVNFVLYEGENGLLAELEQEPTQEESVEILTFVAQDRRVDPSVIKYYRESDSYVQYEALGRKTSYRPRYYSGAGYLWWYHNHYIDSIHWEATKADYQDPNYFRQGLVYRASSTRDTQRKSVVMDYGVGHYRQWGWSIWWDWWNVNFDYGITGRPNWGYNLALKKREEADPYRWGTAGWVDKVVPSGSAGFSIKYNKFNRQVSEIIGPDGKLSYKIEYHPGTIFIKKLVYPDGKYAQFCYAENGPLTWMQDINGEKTTFTYGEDYVEAKGQLVTSREEYKKGKIVGESITVKGALVHRLTYRRDDSGRLTKLINNLTGEAIEYKAFDKRFPDIPLIVKGPERTVEVDEYNDYLQPITEAIKTSAGASISEVKRNYDEMGFAKDKFVRTFGTKISVDYYLYTRDETSKNVTSVLKDGVTIAKNMRYDSTGNLRSYVDAVGALQQFRYDPKFGQLARVGDHMNRWVGCSKMRWDGQPEECEVSGVGSINYKYGVGGMLEEQNFTRAGDGMKFSQKTIRNYETDGENYLTSVKSIKTVNEIDGVAMREVEVPLGPNGLPDGAVTLTDHARGEQKRDIANKHLIPIRPKVLEPMSRGNKEPVS